MVIIGVHVQERLFLSVIVLSSYNKDTHQIFNTLLNIACMEYSTERLVENANIYTYQVTKTYVRA